METSSHSARRVHTEWLRHQALASHYDLPCSCKQTREDLDHESLCPIYPGIACTKDHEKASLPVDGRSGDRSSVTSNCRVLRGQNGGVPAMCGFILIARRAKSAQLSRTGHTCRRETKHFCRLAEALLLLWRKLCRLFRSWSIQRNKSVGRFESYSRRTSSSQKI